MRYSATTKELIGSDTLKVTKLFSIMCMSILISACSGMRHHKHQAPDFGQYRIETIVMMPVIITGASQTTPEANTYYSPGWIRIEETYTTRSLSPAEYYPTEQAYINELSKHLTNVKFVRPGVVDKVMKRSRVSTYNYNQAIIAVAKRFKGDAVIALRLRNVNVQGASAIEGRPKATGHVDLTLYSPAGDVWWSLSAEAIYREGNAIWSPAPTLDSFVSYVMRRFRPDLEELNKNLK